MFDDVIPARELVRLLRALRTEGAPKLSGGDAAAQWRGGVAHGKSEAADRLEVLLLEYGVVLDDGEGVPDA